MKINLRIVLLLLVSLLFVPTAHALEVSKIDEQNGILTLSDGRSVSLLGLKLLEEAYPVLSILVKGREIQVEEEAQAGTSKGRSQTPVYLYVQVSEMSLPISQNSKPSLKKVLVNQELVRMGLANLELNLDFKKKNEFLEVQSEAQKAGRGMWSFTTPKPKTKKVA